MTYLYLIPIFATILIAVARVRSISGTRVEGRDEAVVMLSLTEKIAYHRVSIYSLAALTLLGAVSGTVQASMELVAFAAVAGLLTMPVRYRITSAGIAINNVVFRSWSEFSGYDSSKRSVRLVGKPGNGRFDVRVTGEHRAAAQKAIARHLRSVADVAPTASSGRRIGLVAATGVAVAAVVLVFAVLPSHAFADGPDGPKPNPSGVGIGVPQDLAGVTVGGGSLAVLDKDGKIDTVATEKMFADAQKNEPFAYNLSAYVNENRLAANFTWTLIAGFLVMFMQAGFAMVETGFCRSKSAMHVMMTNFMVYGVGMLAFWVCGFAIMFGGVGGAGNLGSGITLLNEEFTVGGWGLFGHKGFFLGPETFDVSIAVLFLFQMVFMDTAATILTGAVAERWTWVSFLIWGVFIGGFIYPVFGNWAWGGGWLFQLKDSALGRPYVDFAGSGVVHSVGGWAALAGAIVLGPRLGKYNRDGSSNTIPGHDLNMAAIGTFILAFGWFGFNPGSSLGISGNGNLHVSIVAVNTMLAGAAGSVAAMFYGKMTVGKWDPGYMINGILAGLVAITAPSGYVNPMNSVIIGLIAGVLVCVAMVFVETKLRIDDPVGAFSVHGINGIWGVLATGIFADGSAPDFLAVGYPIKGLLYGDVNQFLVQCVGAVTVIVWAFATTFILFSVLKAMGIYRSKPEDEIAGLDLPEMGMHAYPVEIVAIANGQLSPGSLTAAPMPSASM